MSSSRSDHKTKAKLCEHAERYEDMVAAMTALIEGMGKDDPPLDEEERNLLSVAYKNVVGSRRSSWRVLNAKAGEDQNEMHIKAAEEMRKKVEDELNSLCKNVIKLLDDTLISNAGEDIKAKIFFLKMKGDYHRYMVEICGESEALSTQAEDAYKEALVIAENELSPTDPVRLGLALNFSVFYYEIRSNPTKACELAKSAFDKAINGLEEVQENAVYKDSTLIMQLLRDNLTLWASEADEDGDQDD